MSETGALLLTMAERLFEQHFDDVTMSRSKAGRWPEEAWQAMADQGLARALVEGGQGYDVPPEEGLALISLVGRHAAPLPLAETMMGNALLARAGLPIADEAVALVPQGSGLALEEENGRWRASGEADRIAWARNAAALVIEDRGMLAVSRRFKVLQEGSNLAGMPRDRIAVDEVVEAAPLPDLSLLEAGALARSLLSSGALEEVARLTHLHVSERVQFGRPLIAFQAVQHLLAQLVAETAAASAAAGLAAQSYLRRDPLLGIAIAAARVRVGEAAAAATGIAQQLHGAIGFTQEHRLHWFTTALWSWRDEFGTQGWWTRRLGAEALSRPKHGYWPLITSI